MTNTKYQMAYISLILIPSHNKAEKYQKEKIDIGTHSYNIQTNKHQKTVR